VRDIRYQIAVDGEPDNALTEEAAEIEVQQTIEGPTTFRVKFAIDICRGEFNLLDDPRLNPGNPDTRITIVAHLNGEGYVLAHGIITERKVNLAEGGPGSSLEIACEDRRRVMDRKPRSKAHEGTASQIAEQILKTYEFETDVTETEIQYEEDKGTLNQAEETDLAFVTKLAGRNGHRFWIDWQVGAGFAGFEVTETAHFKPSPPQPETNGLGFLAPLLLAPEATAELKLNAGDGCSNVASFELQSNAEAPNQTGPIRRVNADDGDVADSCVPGPTTERLGAQPTAPRQARERRLVTAGDAQEARVRSEAALNDASWSVQATAETSVQALNGFVAPHQIVKVSGAGALNSGDYFVKAVTHTVDSVAHKLRIELLRNALGGA
jgi:phage protein D